MLGQKSKYYFCAAIALHFLAAIFSIGFFSHDEQREVLQLVGYKLGHYDNSYLSFQYHSELRSWLHPALYLWTSKVLNLFSNFNPFIHAFFYRLLSGVFGLLSLWVLYKTFQDELQEKYKEEIFFISSAFLWFIPFLHVRTSNENLGASFFIFALYFFKKSEDRTNALLSGLFFAISFALRFQMAFMMVAVVLWFIVIKRSPFKNIIFIGLSFIGGIGAMFYLDSTLYESWNWTFTPYNYFNINILHGYAASFGVSPWYEYFILAYRDGGELYGLFIALCFIIFWLRFPKHILTWASASFVVIHSLIGHKELRFLFPILFLLPAILPQVVASFRLENQIRLKTIFLIVNIPLAVYYSLIPCSYLMKYYKHLYEKESAVSKVYVVHPFEDYTKFYLKSDIKYPRFEAKPDEIAHIIKKEKETYFFAMNIDERDLILKNSACQPDFSFFPKWVYEIPHVKKMRTFKSWTLIHCKAQSEKLLSFKN